MSAVLNELADTWDAMTIGENNRHRREMLRECADTLRTVLSIQMPAIDTCIHPERSPTHRCTICGAFWIEWSNGWSLCSAQCGPCCDNVAMGDQIVPLVISDLYTRTQPPLLKASGDVDKIQNDLNDSFNLIEKLAMEAGDIAYARDQLAKQVVELREALEWYKETFCEHSLFDEVCGRCPDDECSGCKTMATLAAIKGDDNA
jgi:hypothetical protein